MQFTVKKIEGTDFRSKPDGNFLISLDKDTGLNVKNDKFIILSLEIERSASTIKVYDIADWDKLFTEIRDPQNLLFKILEDKGFVINQKRLEK